MSIFDDFKRSAPFDSETKARISKVFPAELSEILCRYGCGSFLQGYLRLIHPFEYQEVIKDTYFDAEHSIPFMLTAFGDIVVYKEDGYIGMIQYQKHDSAIIGKKTSLFIRLLEEASFRKKYFDIGLYQEAVQKFGELKEEECFGFVPLLALGGKENVEHLQKVNVKVQIELITKFIGKIE